MNFQINEYTKEERQKEYEAYKNYYLNHLEVGVAEIREKLNIGGGKQTQYSKRIWEEEGVRRQSTGEGVILTNQSKRNYRPYKGSKEYEELYNLFTEYYSNCELTVRELQKRMKISNRFYRKLLEDYINRTGKKRVVHGDKILLEEI